jgi:hypothetical protein
VLLGGPAGWDRDGLPSGVTVSRRRGGKPADVVVAFYRRLADLRRDAASIGSWIVDDGMAWVAWPRRAAGHESDLTDGAVRSTVLPTGLVDVKVAALDDDWSGLRFVWPVELRGKRRP